MSADPPQQPDLTRARADVLALVAGSPMSRGAPAVQAAVPIRPLPPDVATKLAVRTNALVPATRDRVPQRVVAPSATLAVVDAVGIGAGAGTGHTVLAVVAGVLFVPLAAFTVLGIRFARRDPARLTSAERRAVEAACRWQSKQTWMGPVAYSQERGLVVAAARAVERIAGSGPWRSGRPDRQDLHIDLAAELDQIDDQAHRIALARGSTAGAPSAEVIDTAWDTAVTRVAALTAYADELAGFDARRLESRSRQGDPVADSNLLAGSASDEMALERVTALTKLLTARIDDPLG